MNIKGITEEDFLQYKKPSMFIICPVCSFKCDKEFGCNICQNSSLARSDSFDIDDEFIVDSYLNNGITRAIVFGGLEPFDTFESMMRLIKLFRTKTDDDIVIYTGYNKDEIFDELNELSKYQNIFVKFGRYVPNDTRHFDNVLGIYLESNNQYAEKIS